jgi:hypothetical protein
MTKEQKLQRVDEYIIWIKIDENYQIMREFQFRYQSEYIEYLDRVKWLITKNHELDDYHRNILNKIEKLIKSK